jgi:hypothetical protein
MPSLIILLLTDLLVSFSATSTNIDTALQLGPR